MIDGQSCGGIFPLLLDLSIRGAFVCRRLNDVFQAPISLSSAERRQVKDARWNSQAAATLQRFVGLDDAL
jgi:hypothetical protein